MNNGLCAESTCPWWLLPTFDNPLRRLVHPAERILAPFVREGDRVLEPGCGGGYFTIPLARLVGATGSATAVDLQQNMLEMVARRAARQNLTGRIRTRLCGSDSLGLAEKEAFDFALAFWMVHEVSDRESFLKEVHDALRTGGRVLIVEPRIHVSKANFDRTAEIAWNTGFRIDPGPSVRFSRSMVLVRNG